MASWPGSEKACPRCKTVGHGSHTCPRRPAPKRSKKRTPASTKLPHTPTTPSSSTIAITADTADKATLISDLTDDGMDTSSDSIFPFDLTDEQVQQLNQLTADEWLQHCQNVRSNAPRTQPEIDTFLSLPMKEIVRIFCAEVHWLVSLTPPHATSSTSTYTLPTPNPAIPIPRFHLSSSRSKLHSFSAFSDA